MAEYVARKRARLTMNYGPLNIPYGSVLEAVGDVLYWQDKPVCTITSQNAYDYFSSNHDGHGLERGGLVSAVLARLVKRDAEYQARWDKVWEDPLSQKYRRPEHEDFWIWSYDFYNAPIEDLRHIAALVGAKI